MDGSQIAVCYRIKFGSWVDIGAQLKTETASQLLNNGGRRMTTPQDLSMFFLDIPRDLQFYSRVLGRDVQAIIGMHACA